MSERKLLGITLAEAQESRDLFTWFCFSKVEEAPSVADALVFRPSGPAFQKLVKLELTLAPDQTITAASLYVLRSFIETNSANAGDLIKSLISYGSDPGVGKLAQEIMTAGLNHSRQPVIVRGDVPKSPERPSAAARVVLGQARIYTLGNLTLENRDDSLVVSLSAEAPKAQGWLERLLHRAR